MHTKNLDQALDQILRMDSRYHREAYLFVREALDHTQKMAAKGGREAREETKEEERHVTGQQLLAGIRAYALKEYGPMTLTLLHEWGVHRCEDFGEIVFNMVESNVLGKTKEDSRDDFKGGYDFEDAFRHPFQPSAKRPTPGWESKSPQVKS